MGAHDVVHPNEAERVVKRHTDGLGVDVVLEMSGVPSAIHQAFALVRVGGHVQMLGIPSKPIEVDFATEVIFKGITVYGVVGRRMYETWHQMTRFLRSGSSIRRRSSRIGSRSTRRTKRSTPSRVVKRERSSSRLPNSVIGGR